MPASAPKKNPVETLLWEKLRRVRFGNWIFEQHVDLGSAIAPFVCLERKVILHIFDEENAEIKEKARYPDGFHVLRFGEREIMRSIDDIIDRIDLALRFLPLQMDNE